MENPRLHEYICDYIDGKMDQEMHAIFEDFIKKNETVRKFVQTALRGRNNLMLLRNTDSVKTGENSRSFSKSARTRILPFSFTLMIGVMFILALSV